jgi:hypothetical protein
LGQHAQAEPHLVRDVLPVLKAHCVKCHGPAKSEAKLSLNTPGGLARGGEGGPLIAPGRPGESLLWQRVAGGEMPPDDPLPEKERTVLERWIAGGAQGLPSAEALQADGSDHWAFAHLGDPPLPAVPAGHTAVASIDPFILAALQATGLSLNAEADRPTLVRRVSYDLTGLPPTLAEVESFVKDPAPNAYEQMVDRYLASPHYGERWGKFWLDAAGYADSNGYFNADSDRPLAYRYRDYVVRAMNADLPFDRFVREQLAGDELAGFLPGKPATPEIVSLLEATHFLRNGQDGTGESDGNDDEVTLDRYFALESASQIVSTALLGLTMQCAKCHDHKFETITQRDYYQLQSVFYPAFNIQQWQKPNERVVIAALPDETSAWEARRRQIDARIAAARADFATWVRRHRPPTTIVFQDDFSAGGTGLAQRWSNRAPGDDAPGGTPPVRLDGTPAPSATRRDGALAILESGDPGDRWISTQTAFDWTPNQEGTWIQVTFDLVDDRVGEHKAAERIAYGIALHDFDDSGAVPGGNILLDGNPAGGAPLHLDYPGSDARLAGDLGSGRYESGHNFGVRITNAGEGKFLLEHVVDGIAEEKSLTLGAADLPNGGFGFEFCCGRSFVVDNVLIEQSAGPADEAAKQFDAQLQARRKQLAAQIQSLEEQRGPQPGKIAWVTDRSPVPPDVYVLERGNHATRGEPVWPMPLSALRRGTAPLEIRPPFEGAQTTGRRLAWARWLTEPGSRPSALLARVHVNRVWQHHFGVGLVATTDNLGVSGAPPSHPELIDHLAARFVASGWSTKTLHRLILTSATYRQSSRSRADGLAADPGNRWLWRFPLQRLDAEALRDAMLTTSGALDRTMGGPYVPTVRDEQGEVLVQPGSGGEHRRSIYLQQRRTQMLSLLNVFDTPSIVFNCVQRPVSTMPLQSLSLLNSGFVVTQAGRFADRLAVEAGADSAARVSLAYRLAFARPPSDAEAADALAFVAAQRQHYAAEPHAGQSAWTDFCQMLLASNAFLYVE